MKSVLITGKRWFQRSYGNTYFSATAYIDGEQVANIDFDYGYGSMFEQAMVDLLEDKGFMPNREHHSNGSAQPGWQYFRDQRGIKYSAEAIDVARKKDL